MANNNLPPPPAPAPPTVPKAAYVEDCPEDDQTSRLETRPPANISSKRSKPDVAHVRAGHDESSDSGISSHTAATLGSSAPSSLESKAGSNPPKVQENTVASKRKPRGTENTVKGRSRSPKKPPEQKIQPRAKKDSSESQSKAKGKKLLGGLVRSMKPPPPPAQLVQDAPKAPPARPRTSTSQSDHRPRPVSVYAGAAPVFMPQPALIETQPSYPPPPLAFPPPSFPPPSCPPFQQPYFPPPQPISPPQDLYNPSLPALIPRPRPTSLWNPVVQSAPRPRSMYSKPMVEYGEEPIYTTIAPGVRPLSHKPPPPPPPGHSHPSSEEYPIRPEDYYKMPPPPPPKSNMKPRTEERPPMVRHAHTTLDAHPPSRSRRSGHEESTKAHASNRSPLKQSFAEHERVKRPTPGSAKRSDEFVPHSLERSTSRMSTGSNSMKRNRRASLYGHESLAEKEASVEAYQNEHGQPAATNALSVETLLRGKKLHGSSSETSSRQSGKSGKSRTSREGSDVRSRRPSSEIKNRNESDGIAMRFHPSQGVNVQLRGGMDGRTISMKQSKDGEGEMEFAIGSRGRTVGSRSHPPSRDRSRRSYSYSDGQGVTEVERHKTSRRPAREYSYHAGSGMTPLECVKTLGSAAESIKEEREPVVVREKVTTRSRSRRQSHSGHSSRGRG